jgi:hypothetical protein
MHIISSRSENSQHFRPQSIDEYRQKFITAPIGCWSQAVGTFSSIHDESWNFYPNRTGEIIQHDPFGGERDKTLFEWKEVADFTIACKVIKYPWHSDLEDMAWEDEPAEWETICYDFKTRSTDVGEIVAMYEIASDGTKKDRFWESLEPLSLRYFSEI